jgi:hypothetical protein
MFRNRGRRWSKGEDKLLVELISKSETLKRISILLERSERSVVIRLRVLSRLAGRGSAR